MAINEMTDHEMLVALMKDKQKRDIISVIKTVLVAVVLVGIAIAAIRYIPKVIALSREIESVMQKADDISKALGDGTIENLKSVIGSLKSLLESLGLS
jgi:hypothetical protein